MILIIHIILITVYGLCAIFFYYKRPAKVNYLFGYWSELSMKNEYTWKEANDFSSTLLVIVAISVLLFRFSRSFSYRAYIQFISATAFLTINTLLMIPVTELHLRSIFDKNGDFKTGAIAKS